MNLKESIFSMYSSFEKGLIWTALAIGIIVFILGFGLFVLWIRYSLVKRNNSLNYTGADVTGAIFNKTGINVEIKNSLFYSKYWNHNKKRGTYRLRPWTYSRKSIWTMMEASQQAYATTIRETDKAQFWIAFRLPQLVMSIGGLIGIALTFWGVWAITSNNVDPYSASWKTWSLIISGLSIIALSSIYATCWRAWCLKKNVVPLIKDLGFSEYELKAIQRIFNWAFLYSIANAILQTLRVILSIADSRNSNSRR